jgi:hypothetical protein
MPRKPKKQRMAELHELAMEQFDESYQATKDDREMAQVSRRFVMIRGEMWSWDVEDQFRNKVKMEIDHVSGAVTRIINEWRKNKITASFLPKDGSNADTLSDACASRYRSDTQNASGREARAAAFDCSVNGGYGGLRLRTEYESEKDGHQKICLEPVNDPELTLFFDVNAKRKDKSDAKHAFLITPWSRRAFAAKYGTDFANWPIGYEGRFKYPWFGENNDAVMVAEYFVEEERSEAVRRFMGPKEEMFEVSEDDLTEEKEAELLATGFVEQEPTTEKETYIAKYVMNGAGVLSGPEEIPGPNIPLVPQYGHRSVINHVERFRGHVVKAMDAQIIYNLQVSKVAETAASSGVEKPIFTPEQIGRHANMWNNDHIDNNAFLLIDPLTDVNGNPQPAGAVAFTRSPEVAPAVGALIALTKRDIADQLGNPENGEQMLPDQSGVALDLIQGRIDMQSFGYMDEAKDAERRVAEIWLGMAGVVYVEEGRKLKVVSENGERSQIVLGRKVQDSETGLPVPEVDFSRAVFDVETDVGPTSASRRSAVVRTVSSILGVTADPETQTILTHVALMNMEGEGLSGVREYSRNKLITMGVEKPTKKEQEALAELQAQEAQQPPPPQEQLALAMAKEAESKAVKATADAGLAVAKTKESEAKTAETLASIPIAQRESAVKTAGAIMDQVQDDREV